MFQAGLSSELLCVLLRDSQLTRQSLQTGKGTVYQEYIFLASLVSEESSWIRS